MEARWRTGSCQGRCGTQACNTGHDDLTAERSPASSSTLGGNPQTLKGAGWLAENAKLAQSRSSHTYLVKDLALTFIFSIHRPVAFWSLAGKQRPMALSRSLCREALRWSRMATHSPASVLTSSSASALPSAAAHQLLLLQELCTATGGVASAAAAAALGAPLTRQCFAATSLRHYSSRAATQAVPAAAAAAAGGGGGDAGAGAPQAGGLPPLSPHNGGEPSA